MNDESYVLENDNVLKDSFISVKRGSTLFPSDVLDNIFSSKLNSPKSKKTFNSDIATIDYFITALKLVRNWEMHNNFYDDDEYYLNYSRYYDDASDI